MNILVTGANGFVGAALIPKLVEDGHQITALVRNKENQKKLEGVTWVEGDLLRPETLPALERVDKVYYLVHGLKENESFEYYESVTAINFINWIRPLNPGIIYLGAIVPNEKLSPHLRSRALTGAILGVSGLSVLEFRASIVLGEGSLSFEMIKALTERIPFRPDFNLLNQGCQPLALNDLLRYLVVALELNHVGHKIVEIGGPDATTYGELLDLYAELSGLKRKRLKIPEVEVKVLLKVLDYAIPEHAEAGKKLTESMEHTTILTNESAKEIFPKVRPKALRVAMDMARNNSKTVYSPLWGKEFLKSLLSDKILVQSGLLAPELLKNLEKVAKIKDILSRSKE